MLCAMVCITAFNKVCTLLIIVVSCAFLYKTYMNQAGVNNKMGLQITIVEGSVVVSSPQQSPRCGV